MSREFIARLGLISLTTSSFYGPVNFSTSSSIVGIATGSVLFTGGSGNITGSGNLTWDGNNIILGVNKGLIVNAGGTNRQIGLNAVNYGVDNLSGGIFYPSSGTNVGAGLVISPKGTGYTNGIKSQIVIHNTDVVADVNNYELAVFRAFTNSYILATGKIGTTTNRPFLLSSGYADGFTNPNHLWLYTSNNVGINTTTDAGYRLDINGAGASAGALRSTSGSVVFDINTGSLAVNNSGTSLLFVSSSGNVGIGTSTPTYKLDVNGNARVQGTAVVNGISKDSTGITTFVIEGYLLSTYTELRGALAGSSANLRLYGVNATNNGSVAALSTSAFVVGNSFLPSSGYRLEVNGTSSTSGSLLISGSNTQPTIVGNKLYSIDLRPTMIYTTGSQTQTALRVLASFSGSTAFTSSQSNIIADFGASSVGSQLIINDITSGSIYMVNDASGLPIIEADSNWSINFYDYPYTVFKKTGSAIEMGVAGQASSSVTLKSDLVINEGLGFYQRTSQVTSSVAGAVTSSLYNIAFTNTSASVYLSAIVTGYDTGSRETITGDVKATIKYVSGIASVIGYNQSFLNSDNSVVSFDVVAGGTSGSLVAYGTGSRTYQFGATVTVQVI